MDIAKGKWGVDLGRRANGKIKWFKSRQDLEDWLYDGYNSTEGAEQYHYEDMLAQLDDGQTILKYDNSDNYAMVREGISTDGTTEDFERLMSGEEIDVKNLWKPTGDEYKDKVNIAKSWLLGASQGQTWPLDDLLDIDVDRLQEIGFLYDYGGIESKFDEIVGYKNDYDPEDPELEKKAVEIVDGLEELSKDAMKNPENYFEEV